MKYPKSEERRQGESKWSYKGDYMSEKSLTILEGISMLEKYGFESYSQLFTHYDWLRENKEQLEDKCEKCEDALNKISNLYKKIEKHEKPHISIIFKDFGMIATEALKEKP